MNIEDTIRRDQFCQIKSEIRGSDQYLIVGIDVAKDKHLAFMGSAAGQSLLRRLIFENNLEGFRKTKVQNWLMSEGWQIAEPTHPEFAWLIRAEDGGERKILVGQNKAREDRIHLEANIRISDDHRKLFESLAEEKRREILWNLRYRLLQMNVDFVGVAEPIQDVILTQRIYLDGLTKDAFIQRFLTVRNAIMAVIWSTIKDLLEVKPPAKSTEKTKH